MIRANDRWLATAGFTNDQAAGKDIWELFPGSPAAIRALHDRVRAGETIDVPEHRQVLGGREIWYEGRLAPVPLPSGTGVLITAWDITARKRAEHALAERERRFEAISENTPDVISRVDRDLRHLYVNRAIEALTGVPRAAFLGRTNRELGMPAEACEIWERDLRAVFESGQPRAVAFAFRSIDGHERQFSAWLVPEPGQDGGVESVLGVARDVTDWNRAQRELRESEERLRSVFEQAAVGIGRVALDGRFLEVNARYADIVGYTVEEMRGLTFQAITHPDDLDTDVGYAARLLSGELRTYSIEKRYVRKDGRFVWVNLTGSVARDATGRPAHFVAVVEDVTARRRAEEALRESVETLEEAKEALAEADRRKTEFLAVLSHELRNPLAPIRNGLYVLSRAEPGSQPFERAKQIMARQLEHVSRLVDDLLDITRITHGKITLERTRVDVREVARRTCDDLRSVFDDRGVRLVVDLPAAPVWVLADATRVSQAIGNLLHNSAKFTPAGGSTTLTLRERDGGCAVRVEDTGSGIEPELLERIFEPFQQAERTRGTANGGLGLGLALVKSIAELHGGEVSAASDGAGRGARFELRLPSLRVAPEAAPATA